MSELYIGLMSGTSADGINLALVDFSSTPPQLLATHYCPYATEQREQILAIADSSRNDIHAMAELDVSLGKKFAEIVNKFLKQQKISAPTITAIGSHGQTVRHHPHGPNPFTLQIGDPNIIAAHTGITTVADFRRKDMAHGGQGAPLVPAFHQQIFTSTKHNRAIVNIGGIANITLLPKNSQTRAMGFDTGPGNVLLDAWTHLHHKKTYDQEGEWARQGKVCTDLLEILWRDPYFQLSTPKSTGREYFNLDWVHRHLQLLTTTPTITDVQTTLVELTAQSIINEIKKYFTAGEIFICGGGAHNTFLMERLWELAQPDIQVASTQELGLAPDWIEAMAFAWLARQTLHKKPGNLPAVTGASKAAILGAVYFV